MANSRRDFLTGLWTGALVLLAAACRGAAPAAGRPAPATRLGPATPPAPRRPGSPEASAFPEAYEPVTPPTPFAHVPLPTPTPLPPLVYPFQIVRRAEWGALPPDHQAAGEYGFFDPIDNPYGWLVYRAPLRDLLTQIVVHHSGRDAHESPLAIQRLHRSTPRFAADIAYHFLVGPEGTLYEGRDLRVRGRHTQGANYGTVGICVLGNFQVDAPPGAQLAALARLVRYLAVTYGIHYLAGHHDYYADTVCPGAQLYARLGDLAAGAGLAASPVGYVPPEWLVTQTPAGWR